MNKTTLISITVFSVVACGGDPNEMPEISGPLNGGAAIAGTCSITFDGRGLDLEETSATAVIVGGKTTVRCTGMDATFGKFELGISVNSAAIGTRIPLAESGNAGIYINFFTDGPSRNDFWVGRGSGRSGGRTPTTGTMVLSSGGGPGQAIAGTFDADNVYNVSNTRAVKITGRFTAR